MPGTHKFNSSRTRTVSSVAILAQAIVCACAGSEGRLALEQMAAAATQLVQSTMAETCPASHAHCRRKALNAMGASLRILER